MPSAHCDSNGSSGSGDQMPGLAGVHDADDDGSRMGHNTDCAQPMLMPYFFFSFQLQITTHTYEERQRIYLFIAVHTSFILFGCFPHTTRKKKTTTTGKFHTRGNESHFFSTHLSFSTRALFNNNRKNFIRLFCLFTLASLFLLLITTRCFVILMRARPTIHTSFSALFLHTISLSFAAAK